jgi:hypothetical protein
MCESQLGTCEFARLFNLRAIIRLEFVTAMQIKTILIKIGKNLFSVNKKGGRS